ncbi:hypothetical protein PHMEG_00025729 [Phytophthora megakarya]|uniref:Uncharacterized protein n=1 Tax=Phytophthora megakarya TaxID=4795 RepID=A0A225VD16_9STRA|nr:hypothetical protein PHMEG_00025729 [Phytophthora megakarya]
MFNSGVSSLQKLAGSKLSSANAKYTCKRLNGQQFFDDQLSHELARCPFFVNVSGGTGAWQPTKANFCHSHLKNVGFQECHL